MRPADCQSLLRNTRQLDAARSSGFVRAAAALLDAGASANTGFFDANHSPAPERESVLYGAAGIAHHADLTRVLLARGADPNDGEVAYHAPESLDNHTLQVLLESRTLTDDSLTTMLLRKADWHDRAGIDLLLAWGADPNRMSMWGSTALHQAVRRDNGLEIIEALLDRGADPSLEDRNGHSATIIAARRGRGDVLETFERRGSPIALTGAHALVAACARNAPATIASLIAQDGAVVDRVVADGGTLLAEFAGGDNVDGVQHLLDVGVDVAALYTEGDSYFGIAKHSLAIHVAAWRASHRSLKCLIARGSPVDVPDGDGRTPLALAVRACVDSYWMDQRSPESVEALLRAGASPRGVTFPSGYADVDALLSMREC